MRILLALFVLIALPARALAEDELYLLGDSGVKVNLTRGWVPSKWSDAELRADSGDKSVALYAWSTPVQSVPAAADIDLYAAEYGIYLAELGVEALTKIDAKVQDRAGTPTVRGSWSFKLGNGVGRLTTSSFAVEGALFHLGCVSSAANAKKAEKTCDELLGTLELRKPAAALPDGGKVEKEGATVDLPAGWRAPLPSEEEAVTTFAGDIPVQDFNTCSLAIRPRGPARPDLMATCQGGILLGIVDEYTFEEKEAVLRPKVFGKAPVTPATRLELPDRTAFLYKAELQGRPLSVAIAPYDKGVARMYVLGTEPKDADLLNAAARDAMLKTTFSGDHPVSPDETVVYFATYHPTDPRVLGVCCSSTCCVLGAAALIGLVVVRSRRKKPAGYDDYS